MQRMDEAAASVTTSSDNKLLPKDVLLMPARFLFADQAAADNDEEEVEDCAVFTIRFTDKLHDKYTLTDADKAFINIALDTRIRCKIRHVFEDGSASIKIALASDRFIYAQVKPKVPVNGIRIYRPVTEVKANTSATSSPTYGAVKSTVAPLLLFRGLGSSGSGLKMTLQKWHAMDISPASTDVALIHSEEIALLGFDQPLVDAAQFAINRNLVLARRKLINLLGKHETNDPRSWVSAKEIKAMLAKLLRREMGSLDIIPNLFSIDMSKFDKIFAVFKLIAKESEINSEIASVYENILQEFFPPNTILGHIIGEWSLDRDKIKGSKDHMILLDLFAILFMLGDKKPLVLDKYANRYPKTLAVIETFSSAFNKAKAGEAITVIATTQGKDEIERDLIAFAYKFGRFRVLTSPKSAPTLYG